MLSEQSYQAFHHKDTSSSEHQEAMVPEDGRVSAVIRLRLNPCVFLRYYLGVLGKVI